MVRIPSFCEKCKFVFESNFIGSISKGATVHTRGSGVPCPKCGGMTKMIDVLAEAAKSTRNAVGNNF